MVIARFKLADVTAALTRFEVRDALYAVYARMGIATTAWESGGVVRVMTAGLSIMLAGLSEFQAEIARSGFLEYARGPWLRIKAKYDYDVTPDDATFATGSLTLTNTGGGIYSVGAGSLVVRHATTGKQYRNVASFDIGAQATVTITIIALEAGTASNANAGAVTEYVSEQLPRVTITNPTALIARDDESPAELRARCKEKLGSLSPMGPWDAYSFAARETKLASGESAGITRTKVSRDGYGNLYLHVASASGGVTGTVGDLNTALGAIDEAVQRTAAPLGITAHVLSAVPRVITIAYQAYVRNTSGLSTEQIRTVIAAALVEFITTHPLGGVKLASDSVNGWVFDEAICAVIHNALPEIFRVVLVTPAGDTELTPSEVPVLLHDPSVHATIIAVAPPEGSLA